MAVAAAIVGIVSAGYEKNSCSSSISSSGSLLTGFDEVLVKLAVGLSLLECIYKVAVLVVVVVPMLDLMQ